jgi:DNA-binding winged helix-turn-helix (wHTH) protein
MNTANVISLSASRPVADENRPGRGPALNPVHVRFGAFELDEANARLMCGGTALTLAPRPFGLLCALVRRAGSLLTKNALLDAVWGHQFVSESVLKTAVSDLRTLLDDHPREPRFIETVSRRGYRFIAPTTVVSSTAAVSDRVSVNVNGCQGQSCPAARARLSRGWDRACDGKDAALCAAPKVSPCGRETDRALPEPVFATTEEVCYAHQLRLQLRAHFLHHATQHTEGSVS